MLCPNCKDRPLNKNLISVKCINCGENFLVNASFVANICGDCSDKLSDCFCCGKGIKQDILKVFHVKRMDRPDYCEDISSIVVAADAMWAEKLARLKSSSLKKVPLKVTEIDLTKEGVLLTDNVGA